MNCHLSVPVQDVSQPSSARFAAHEQAERAGFDETDVHRAGLVATELATNLHKHTPGGELLVGVIDSNPPGEIEIIAIDKGAGIGDITSAMRDGYSTAGSPGTGLGAARRLSDDFELFTTPGKGTVVWTRLRGRRAPAPPTGLVVAGVSIAKQGEPVCGDAWTTQTRPGGAVTLVADGLGHGLHASEASLAATREFQATRTGTATSRLERVHAALRHTRGAAGAILDVDPSRSLATFSGVGNIAGVIVHNGTLRHTVSNNGTLGHEARLIREYQYPWAPGALFVMHSDGLATHWQLSHYPGILQRPPAVIAAVLYRDHSRGRDDVTVVVGREVG